METPGLSDGVVVETSAWSYKGQVLAGTQTPHGRGTCTFKRSGQKYEGEYRNGKRTGEGVFTWAEGDRYEGEFKDGDFNGRGVHTWPDGRRYEGEWKDDKRSGIGVYNYTDGRRYEGAWKDDKRSGRGVYTFTDGRQYEGEWKDGDRSGMGMLWLAGGFVFDGAWAGDFPLQGTAMEPDGALSRATFNGKTALDNDSWSKALRAPAGRVTSGGPPPAGGSSGQLALWNGRAELSDGSTLEGTFLGLRPHGAATLTERGGAAYTAVYDGERTIAEGPVPVRKQARCPALKK